MSRRTLFAACLTAFALLSLAAGPAAAQYRQPVHSRPVVNYNGGGWYAGGYPGGRVGGVPYAAPIYAGAPQTYYNGYPATFGGGNGFYVPPVYQPFNYVPVRTYGYVNYGYGFRYGY